ncbi:MAG: acyl-CoA thioesterase [Bacteroidales bacterium]|nr:acyl-CoA thioesterase [Bacteroidales bacterium]MCF8458655.1 acyl-CoA thioesterase [Bacteroidales bacterium]
MKVNSIPGQIELTDETEINIRFSEVDSMGIVWHGNYIKYFEDGRESWGKQHGLQYLDVYSQGVVTPIVHTSIDHKKPLRYGEMAIIKTIYEDCEAAKLIYHYTIFRKSDREVIATGKTIQVFLNTDGDLLLNFPDFVIAWKKKKKLR